MEFPKGLRTAFFPSAFKRGQKKICKFFESPLSIKNEHSLTVAFKGWGKVCVSYNLYRHGKDTDGNKIEKYTTREDLLSIGYT